MPICRRCCICGRLCGNVPHDAKPYKNGYACDECYITRVIPAKKQKGDKFYKYGESKTN